MLIIPVIYFRKLVITSRLLYKTVIYSRTQSRSFEQSNLPYTSTDRYFRKDQGSVSCFPSMPLKDISYI